jgi:hypothetical protein
MVIRICPNCRKEYNTILERPKNDTRPIQEIFPNASLEHREQHISGLCSNKCWNQFLGLGGF